MLGTRSEGGFRVHIATIGEALIDFKATDRMTFQGYVGGCHLNVAVAAARLGAHAGFAGQLSKDFFGDEIRAHMQANGVDDGFVLVSNAPTTLAFVSERGGDAHFQFFGERAADRMYDPRPRPEFPGELAFLMFGSISLLHEPVRSAILDVVAAHRDRCTTVLDPNIRPLLVDDRARYLADVESWLPLAGLVKASAQDLAWLVPDRRPSEVADRWLASGPRAVILTRGAEAIELHRPGRDVLTVRPPQVATVDTVGAGDTFTAALMTSLVESGVRGAPDRALVPLKDETWRSSLQRAAAAAALSCTRAGADPPTRAELENYLSGV